MSPFHFLGDDAVCNPGPLVLGRRELEESKSGQGLCGAESSTKGAEVSSEG